MNWKTGVAAIAIAGALGGALASGLATAQDAPESLLPPGFDDPAPAPTPAPQSTSAPPVAPPSNSGAAPRGAQSSPTAPNAGSVPGSIPNVPQLSDSERSGLPSLAELEELSTDELDDLLGLKPQYDIPPAARRSLARVGVLAPSEGGLATKSLANQPERLVRAILKGTKGPLVSRWGHIMMRRALASRLETPNGMNPVEFAALRAGVLNSMGEFTIARALVQDIDAGNWNDDLTSQAITAYIGASDIVGTCPAIRLGGSRSDNPQWVMLSAICNAYAGEGALASRQLNTAQNEEIAPEIDLLLAQRFAGAAGRGRGGTTVSWEGVEGITPWRFSLAKALGETIPAPLLDAALESPSGSYYMLAGAGSTAVPINERIPYAEFAATRGVFSAKALVGLYSELYNNEGLGGDAAQRAARLRDAYVTPDPAARIAAMRGLWDTGATGFAGQILTAYAAARVPPAAENLGDAPQLIGSMLTAGLDRDAMAWEPFVEEGSLSWGLLALSNPNAGSASIAGVDDFLSNDDSQEARKSAFLIAGLGGLGRLPGGDVNGYGAQIGVDFARQTRWTRMIDRAAQVNNKAMVAFLAGLGMQGESWSQMTPVHLYHLVSALNQVGLNAEARMIAAEAVARG
ncbi:hypothetical protein EH31_00625 [Erythrobacter longus]|uniref:Uncharacterized protein n=1 Tax=Erythrobacter longus TaxID=1044 RepID=A0A074MZZ7_ERYLO|nr:hypothetical protein [Erythrobacter longus]KEO91202.1 hypothetical protein EH31_00625 [Erythrobacter longus]